MTIQWSYRGDRLSAEHLEGIPARSLTVEEFAALTPAQQKAVRGSTIYREIKPAPPEPAPTQATEKSEKHEAAKRPAAEGDNKDAANAKDDSTAKR